MIRDEIVENRVSPVAAAICASANSPAGEDYYRRPDTNPLKELYSKEFEVATPSTPNVVKLKSLDALEALSKIDLERSFASYLTSPENHGDAFGGLIEKINLHKVIKDIYFELSAICPEITSGEAINFRNLRLSNSADKILFNSLSQVVLLAVRYENYLENFVTGLFDRKRKIDPEHVHTIDALEEYVKREYFAVNKKILNSSITSEINYLSEIDDCNIRLIPQSFLLGEPETEKVKPRHIDLIVKSLPEPEQWTSDPYLSAEKFKLVFVEACLQLYGGIPENYQRALDGLTIASGRYWIKGEDLANLLTGKTRNASDDLIELHAELSQLLEERLRSKNLVDLELACKDNFSNSPISGILRKAKIVAEEGYEPIAFSGCNNKLVRAERYYHSGRAGSLISAITKGPYRLPRIGPDADTIIRLNSLGSLKTFLEAHTVSARPVMTNPQELDEYKQKFRQEFKAKCADVIGELIARKQIDPSKTLTTASLGNLKLCDSNGLIYFESFGQFIVTTSNVLVNVLLHRDDKITLAVQRTWAPTEWLQEIAHMHGVDVPTVGPIKQFTGSHQELKYPRRNIVQIEALSRLDPSLPKDQYDQVARECFIEASQMYCDADIVLGYKEIYLATTDGSIIISARSLANRAYRDYPKLTALIENAEYVYFNEDPSQNNPATNSVGKSRSEPPQHIQTARELYRSLDISPRVIFAALCALGLERDTRRAYGVFRQVVFEASDKHRGQNTGLKQGVLDIIADLAEHAYKKRKELAGEQDFLTDVLVKATLTNLLKQICYKKYQGDFKQIIEEISNYSVLNLKTRDQKEAEKIKQLFASLCPDLIQLFQALADFETPVTIKQKLLPQQREAVVGVSSGRPIILFGQGAGKTLSCAATAEHINSGHVLWCTKDGIRHGAVHELSANILSQKKVGLINKKVRDLTPSEFHNFLNENDYIVTGYTSLRLLRVKNPEKFAILKEFFKHRIKIVDEAHLLDNLDSEISVSVQQVPTKHTVISTATPFQHRHERLATILHIACPDVFKREHHEQLLKEFKKDPATARATLHAYSTVYSITDIARRFVSPREESFSDQLKKGPCIPTLEVRVEDYALTEQQCLAYIRNMQDSLSRKKSEFKVDNYGLGANVFIERLLVDPELLGIGKPAGLIDRAKKLIVEKVDAGEKVLVFAHRIKPLKLLAEEPEIKDRGVVLLYGDIDPMVRHYELKRFEVDPQMRCVLAQVAAVGTGSNCRGVTSMIFLDTPKISSQLPQACARAIRLLLPGDEQFAHEKVEAVFLNPTIPKKYVAAIRDEQLQSRIKRGTIYTDRLLHKLAQMASIDGFTSKNDLGSGKFELTIDQLIENVARRVSGFYRAQLREEKLAASGRTAYFGQYGHSAKNLWREQVLADFVRRNIGRLEKPVEKLRVALLPGPEGLEIPVYMDLGIKSRKIYAFEGGPQIRKRLVALLAEELGIRFVPDSIERSLPHFNREIDILSMDPDGYITKDVFSMFAFTPVAKQAIVMKNTLAKRESAEASNLLKAVDNDRLKLDTLMLKLTGSARSVDFATSDYAGFAMRGRVAAIELAKAICDRFSDRFSLEDLTECIWELFLESPHILDFQQARYISDKGLSYLSSFALIEKWDQAVVDSELCQHLQYLVRSRLQEGVIVTDFAQFDQAVVKPEHVESLLKYFKSKVMPQHYFMNCSKAPIFDIKLSSD